ncbi:MAG: dipeptide epimerase [Pseudoflavonifractor sp.]
MKIADIQWGEISLPLARPFKTALRTVGHLNDIAVRVLGDDGQVGYGEAPPTAVLTGDTLGSIVCAVEDYIRPALLGMDLDNLEEIMERLAGCIVHNTSAKAAVDMAVYDLYGKHRGLPLYQLLGGARQGFETDITISVNAPEEMVADSLDAVSRGFRILKTKVGKDAATDLARIAAIRAAVGPEVRIRVDANQGWTREEAVALICGMEDRGLHLDLIEQPVRAGDLEGMAYIRAHVHTPILADESVFSADDAARIIRLGAADYLNIKLMKTGGIWQALKLCRIAEEHGTPCLIGCMLESKLSVSAAGHLCCGQEIITMADLDGPSLCATDPYSGGPLFEGPRVTMTDLPGIGVGSVPCAQWS